MEVELLVLAVLAVGQRQVAQGSGGVGGTGTANTGGGGGGGGWWFWCGYSFCSNHKLHRHDHRLTNCYYIRRKYNLDIHW
jgi:hypothetical protein